jgi:hypothetical protein
MRLTPLRSRLLILFMTALLMVLLGGRFSAPGAPHSAHLLAWYCPAPPVTC